MSRVALNAVARFERRTHGFEPVVAASRESGSANPSWPLAPSDGAPLGAVPKVPLNLQGRPGPGVTSQHLYALQAAADADGIAYVVHGSRQTGKSCHTGERFRPDSDLDLGVLSTEALLAAESWQNVPNADHEPMTVWDSLAAALADGCLVVLPRR